MPSSTGAADPLQALSTPIQFVKGVGPRRGEVLQAAGVEDARDLLWYLPRRYLDRSTVVPIGRIQDTSAPITIVGEVRSSRLVERGRGRGRFELRVADASGSIDCVWFRSLAWIKTVFKLGERVAFHGKPQEYGGRFSLIHPDFDKLDAETAALDTGRIIPLYPGGAALDRVGLNSRSFRRIIYHFFKERGLEIPEILPESVRERHHLMEGRVALRAMHFPKSEAELQQARARLKFEELLFIQVMLAQTRQSRAAVPGLRFDAPGPAYRRFIDEGLPFSLTGAQVQALADITEDMQRGEQMNRLLQGDVGSGKTVVAVAAMLHAHDSGYQSAFMAPTEILADQHYVNLQSYLEPLGLQVRLLTGTQGKRERDRCREEIAAGDVQVAVGTHALIQEGVDFHRLGLAVVDEQHRFGVMQRAQLFTKGENPHMLLMTATPIPRSLAMTLYGDLDVSLMRERPAGRKSVETRIAPEKERDEVYAFVAGQLDAGRQAYVVYPLVEESEKVDLKDAENGFLHLQEVFGRGRVGLVHGKMKPADKEQAMASFKRGDTSLLVSTTVIEVGVDVPNATIMVIEHAERFGLSQLHQLRGRVGRGAEQSYCVLMAGYPRTDEGERRLEAMAATDDGFRIAEIDLKLRGAGDFFGTRQSGMPDLKIADLVEDVEILSAARDAARELIARDAELSSTGTLRDYYRRYYAERFQGFVRVG